MPGKFDTMKKAKHTNEGGLAAPQEFSDAATETAEAPPEVVAEKPDPFRIVAARPTRQVRYESGGKLQTATVIDKAAFFSLPQRDVALRISSIGVKPKSGHVVIYDKDGAMLAKYPDRATAAKALEGIDLEAVSGGSRLNPK